MDQFTNYYASGGNEIELSKCLHTQTNVTSFSTSNLIDGKILDNERQTTTNTLCKWYDTENYSYF